VPADQHAAERIAPRRDTAAAARHNLSVPPRRRIAQCPSFAAIPCAFALAVGGPALAAQRDDVNAASVAVARLESPLHFWVDTAHAAFEADLLRLRPGTTIPWLTSDGRQIELTEWRSSNISLLTARTDYDPILVRRLVDALDAYWKRCVALCGNAPPPDPGKGPLVRGRAIIAEAVMPAGELPIGPERTRSVPVLAVPGVARVSVGTEVLEELLRGLNRADAPAPLGDRVPLAIARSFVFFETELGAAVPERFTPLAHALAFLLAGEAQETLGWVVPPDDRPFETIVERYRMDASATYETTLAKDRGHGDHDAEALWTALLLHCRHASGQPSFASALWRTLYECPPAADADIAVGNLIVAISAAGRRSAIDAFRAWRFPISPLTEQRVNEALSPREFDLRKRERTNKGPAR
jgi:hypothetical protein